MAPPTHAEYITKFSGMYSGGFTRAGLIADEQRLASFWNRSSNPVIEVVPPQSTVFSSSWR
nr:hypothetical protein Iba_chr01aCG2070 [Ipomoea batatas]GMC48880.1 hypothetical protein Iba_chr01bCG2600 [Ipomoea batatas]GMC51032.1 hypothetical protein Iba_chr01cCG2420 [Ipomoea batatas]GMC52886.1 hypothetical protein Iba_chr01dCG1520 [Ipomoea batatas]GMC56528.1 hypothetical protein Iba_chr01fCG7960 [Ipomoea batatas]